MPRHDTASLLSAAETFIWKDARLLDRRRFAAHWKGAPQEDVLSALRAYQNEDGGFGNALEPDIRCHGSQPVATQMALEIMAEQGSDEAMLRRTGDFLASVTTDEGGVPNALPSLNGYPRAPWWNAEENPPASVNPTAALAGLLYKLGSNHSWLDGATDYCWRIIEGDMPDEVHSCMAVLLFLEHAPDRERAERAFEQFKRHIFESGMVALETNAEGYVQPPLIWAPSPESMGRRLFDDATIETHLDALEEKQAEDGGWPISWPAVSPAGETEWRGFVTVNALKTLRAYGRL